MNEHLKGNSLLSNESESFQKPFLHRKRRGKNIWQQMREKENPNNEVVVPFLSQETFPKILYSLLLTRRLFWFLYMDTSAFVRSFVHLFALIFYACVCVYNFAFCILQFDNLFRFFFKILFACINGCCSEPRQVSQCLAHILSQPTSTNGINNMNTM